MNSDRTPSLLVVDDEEVDALAIKRALDRRGLKNPIVRVTNAVEAFEVLRGTHGSLWIDRPYVILLDLNMPRMTGHEFLDELRSDAELQDSVVFVLSTSRHPRDRAWAYAKHVAAYLEKPATAAAATKLVTFLETYLATVVLPTDPPDAED